MSIIYVNPTTQSQLRKVLQDVNINNTQVTTGLTAAEDRITTIESVYVSSASTFDTDNVLIRANGTSRAAQKSSAVLADTGALALNLDSSLETSGTHQAALEIKDSTGTTAFSVQAFLRSSSNFAVGDSAGVSVTTGTGNFLFGNNAGSSITTGNSNVCVGNSAGDTITTASSNIAIGTNSLGVCSTGGNNVSIGSSALPALVSGINTVGIGVSAGTRATGNGNVFIGTLAGDDITSGSNSVYIGLQAGDNTGQLTNASSVVNIGYKATTKGNSAVAIGYSSTAGSNGTTLGRGAESGTDSVAVGAFASADSTSVVIGSGAECSSADATLIGYQAGSSAVSVGTSFVGIGKGAGQLSTIGNNCIFAGAYPGYNATIGIGCTLMGSLSGYTSTLGNYNLGVGDGCFYAATAGANNFALGRNAARSLNSASADDNVFIGYEAGYDASQKTDANNTIAIGNGVFSTANNQAVLGASTITETVLRGQVSVTNAPEATSKQFTLSASTTGTTITSLTLAGGGTVMTMPDDSTWLVEASISAIRDDGSEGAAYIFRVTYRKDGSAAPTLIGSLTSVYTVEDDSSWDALITSSSGGLLVRVIGASSKNINWAATVKITEAAI